MDTVKKFRRGKNFQSAYVEIGTANSTISNLKIEVESHLKYGQTEEAESKQCMIDDLRKKLKEKYSQEIFDLEYYLPQISGLYVKRSKRDILNPQP